MKKAFVSVINDLVTDQRVHKSCLTLTKAGFKVLLVGRVLHNSPPMPERPYDCKRMRLLFEKGPLFYAEFNLRLFFLLFWHRADILLANDLDTLLPNFLISRLRKRPLIFDSHEYFTETPELVNRKLKQKIWKNIEKFVVSRLDEMITVNDSIANLFRHEYGLKVHVIRNLPLKYTPFNVLSRNDLHLPVHKKILILQGSGINVDRGAEELVMAMKQLPELLLLIIGGGDVIKSLHEMVEINGLQQQVTFLPRMPYAQMMQYTQNADLGLTLDKDTNLNYRLSLPNKIFDYIQAGIPVLASPLPEIKKIIDTYDLGTFVINHDPEMIASAIKQVFDDSDRLQQWQKNTIKAAKELCWENEENILLNIYGQYN
ncbi:MAG: glycosyltransferase [Bacteroidetes bacterium HGW-Bacteroidetes-1]|nr:MAG: glycosyltransferase [Bacteroidetes bacterium HGW-Bacteroidetes-1]